MLINVLSVMIGIVTIGFLSFSAIRVINSAIAAENRRLSLKVKVRPEVEVKMTNDVGDRMLSIAKSDRLNIYVMSAIARINLVEIKRIIDECHACIFSERIARIVERAKRIHHIKHKLVSLLMEMLRKTNNFNLLKFIEITPWRELINKSKNEEELHRAKYNR